MNIKSLAFAGCRSPIRFSVAIAIILTPGVHTRAESLVPYVGCAGESMTGPFAARSGDPKPVDLDPGVADQLAFYESGGLPGGVLAPRGWVCSASVGASGQFLIVHPKGTPVSSGAEPPSGPAIVLRTLHSDTSGAFEVAGYLARVFPGRAKSFIENLEQSRGVGPLNYSFGPDPDDKQRRIGASRVEFETPADREGLGSQLIGKSELPTFGLIDAGKGDLPMIVLSTKLPPALRSLQAPILNNLEATIDAGWPL